MERAVMKHLWQRLIHKIARKLKLYGTLDSEKALRKKNSEISHLKQELAQAHKRQWGYKQSAWNSEQSPRTDPQLQARLEAQKRKNDMKAFLHCDSGELPHIPRFNSPTNVRSGELMRKHTTRKLTIANTDTVMNVPTVPRMPHKPNLMLHSGLYPGETAYSTPAFLQDQDKKIS